jgi:hypothetical protein
MIYQPTMLSEGYLMKKAEWESYQNENIIAMPTLHKKEQVIKRAHKYNCLIVTITKDCVRTTSLHRGHQNRRLFYHDICQ